MASVATIMVIPGNTHIDERVIGIVIIKSEFKLDLEGH